MRKVFLMLAEDPSFGAAGNLLNALYKNGHEVSAMFTRKDEKEFWKRIEIPKDQNVVMSTDLSWWDYDSKNISILFGRGTPNETCYRLAYDKKSQTAYFTYTEF